MSGHQTINWEREGGEEKGVKGKRREEGGSSSRRTVNVPKNAKTLTKVYMCKWPRSVVGTLLPVVTETNFYSFVWTFGHLIKCSHLPRPGVWV